MTTLESDIEGAFVTYAESLDCHAMKLRIDGMNGWPDRTVICPCGRIMFIEFKRPGGKVRPMQRVWAKILRNCGFLVITPNVIGEAESKLDQLLGGHYG